MRLFSWQTDRQTDKDTSALREMFQHSALVKKPFHQCEIAKNWRAFQIKDQSRHGLVKMDYSGDNSWCPCQKTLWIRAKTAIRSRGCADCFHSILQCIPTLVPLRLAGRLDPCWFDLETKVLGPRILESPNMNRVFSILSAMFLMGFYVYSIGCWRAGWSF